MSNSSRLEGYTNVIESAICRFDLKYEQSLNDAIFQKSLELIIGRHHFKDETIGFSHPLEEEGFKIMDVAITEGLSSLSPEDLSRTLGTVHRSILRHKGYNSREYIDSIHAYVGPAEVCTCFQVFLRGNILDGSI